MANDSALDERLESFATRAKRVEPACDNEEQTKVSLINPYLEILGYDVRDPAVCRLEYEADIGAGRERVDYAIMRDGRPLMLIEAKAATESLPPEAPPQLQRYFVSKNVEFAALTNGVVWQWYQGKPDGKLREAPFLVHDVRSPEMAERPWLRSVSEPDFNTETARTQAEAASTSSAILSWIDETRRRPSNEFLRLVIREKKLGQANAPRVERVRKSFIATFELYVDRVTDRLLAAARERQHEEPSPARDIPQTSPEGSAEPRVHDLGDGGPPLIPEARPRAWRVKGGTWQREPGGRTVFVAVLRHLASIDSRGRDRFYDEVRTARGARMFSDRPPEGKAKQWRRIEPDVEKFVKVHHSNEALESLLAQACRECRRTSGAPVRLGDEIEVLLVL